MSKRDELREAVAREISKIAEDYTSNVGIPGTAQDWDYDGPALKCRVDAKRRKFWMSSADRILALTDAAAREMVADELEAERERIDAYATANPDEVHDARLRRAYSYQIAARFLRTPTDSEDNHG